MTTIDLPSLQTQPIPQLVQLITSALEHPLVIKNLSTIAHPTVISRLENANNHTTAQLLTIFATGTTADLLKCLTTPGNEDLCRVLTPAMYLNLQIITMVSLIEKLLLSPAQINALSTQVAFVRIPFMTLWEEMNGVYGGKELGLFFQNNIHSYPNFALLATPTPILTLITTSFSRQIISGMIHGVVGDLDGVLELRDVLVHRPLPPPQQTTSATIVTIDDMIGALDSLIGATNATVGVV